MSILYNIEMGRCPNGSRKNKKSGACVRKNVSRKRCPNGSRKNKSGNCSRKVSRTKKFSVFA